MADSAALRIDLRSDSVTLPTEAMRRALANARVGDDQYGEDPSVNELQERVAALLRKEQALLVPTGTMANQIALRVLTNPGDEVIAQTGAHIVSNEAGASGANAGVQFLELGRDGLMSEDELDDAITDRSHPIRASTVLLSIEDTHNQAGGIVVPATLMERLCGAAKGRGLSTYLDGARLFNAVMASADPVHRLTAPFDMVVISLSKGLGAPAGSVLAASSSLIAQARRERKRLGGAMGQVGFLATAGMWALDHHIQRLEDDHASARHLAHRLAAAGWFDVDLAAVQTNIVKFRLVNERASTGAFLLACNSRGVLLNAYRGHFIRAVTHMGVSATQCDQAADVMVEVAESLSAAPVGEVDSNVRPRVASGSA